MPDLKIGSLFSGYEGLGRAVQSVLGGDIAWVSDIDPGACKILAHRYPDVPNIGDITAVDWSAVEPVDVLAGGFPCTDVSSAGLRLGLTPDTRSGLWTQMAYAIDKLRPPLVVIENVRGLLSASAEHPAHRDHFHPLRGAMEPCPWCVGDGSGSPLRALGAVLGDLADIGYDASWQGIRAADVGAPHGRFRVFVVAWDASGAARGGSELRDLRTRPVAAAEPGEPAGATPPHPADDGRERGRPSRHGRDGSAHHGDSAADADRDAVREQPVGLAGRRGPTVTGLTGTAAATHPNLSGLEGAESAAGRQLPARGTDPDTSRVGRRSSRRDDGVRTEGLVQVAWGDYEPAVRRWERCLGRPAPSPTELSAKGSPRLSPAFVEWMQGLPAGWVTDVPGLTRNEQLKALGNGVVPQQAAQALRMLLPDVAEVAA